MTTKTVDAPAPRIETQTIPTAVLKLLRDQEMEKQPIHQRQQATLAGWFLSAGIDVNGGWTYDLNTGQISRQVPNV